MLDFVIALWLGFIGACIGSFLNVVAYRMPQGMSIVWKPSHCPCCGRPIRPRDNVPVLGWLLLRGRCRDCNEPISPRYAAVEAAMGGALFVLAYAELFRGGANLPSALAEPGGSLHSVIFPNWDLLILYGYHAVLLSLLLAMGLIDQDRQPIPRDLPLLAGFFVAAAIVGDCWHFYPERTRNIRVAEWKSAVDALLGAAWGASFWLVPLAIAHRRASPDMRRLLRNAALASAAAGAFLGLRPIVRLFVFWLPTTAIASALSRHGLRRISPLLVLWLAALMHLTFWGRLAKMFSW